MKLINERDKTKTGTWCEMIYIVVMIHGMIIIFKLYMGMRCDVTKSSSYVYMIPCDENMMIENVY